MFARTRVFSWRNSVSLCLPNFVLQGKTCLLLQFLLIFTFEFQSPKMERMSFLVSVLEGLVGLQRTVQLQLLQY